jgi:hypothetical protein
VNQLSDFLSLLAQALLIIALPVVIAAAVQHFRAMARRHYDSLNEERQQWLDRAVKIAVQVAEQTGFLEGLAGSEKRDRAIEVAQAFLEERGVTIDLDRLVALIEAEVLTQFSNPSVPADTPQARQALIDKAIEAAVLAAEQSGLKGLIKNVGEEKKAYAMQVARQYLNEHGITIDEELASGLIEAQLLRLSLAAHGALPHTGMS